MRDDAFGHRDYVTGEPFRDTDDWLEWDYALIAAYQFIDVHTDDYGLHSWEVADEAVDVQAIRKQNKFLAARDAITNGKNYKPWNGEYFVPDVFTRRSSGEFWTPEEWMAEEVRRFEADKIVEEGTEPESFDSQPPE